MPLSSSHQDQACVSLMGEEEDESTRKEGDTSEVKTGENKSREFLKNSRLMLITILCVPVLLILLIVLVTKGLQGLFFLLCHIENFDLKKLQVVFPVQISS